MTARLFLTIATLVGLAVAAFAAPARACQIPVFRFALERWEPEAYDVAVFHRGPLTAEQQATIDALAGVGKRPANTSVTPVDVDAKLSGEAAKLWAAQPEAAKSAALWAVVRPADDERAGPTWAGPLTEAAIATVIDSPARHHIATRILAGETAVWALIESGDKAADDAAAKLLSDELARLQAGAIRLPDFDPNAPGPKLRSALPLKLAFSVVRVAPADPAETVFAAMLTRGMPAPKDGKPRGPVVVPVLGRGRALIQLAGDDLTADAIGQVAKFIVGECSCQVKELNPGFDLLMAADWGSILDAGAVEADERQGKRPAIPDPVIGSGKPKLPAKP